MNNFENQCVVGSYTNENQFIVGNDFTIRVPKLIARVKLCGGALTFNFYDTDPIQFEMPTKEQCENLKKTFGIEVELVDKD